MCTHPHRPRRRRLPGLEKPAPRAVNSSTALRAQQLTPRALSRWWYPCIGASPPTFHDSPCKCRGAPTWNTKGNETTVHLLAMGILMLHLEALPTISR